MPVCQVVRRLLYPASAWCLDPQKLWNHTIAPCKLKVVDPHTDVPRYFEWNCKLEAVFLRDFGVLSSTKTQSLLSLLSDHLDALLLLIYMSDSVWPKGGELRCARPLNLPQPLP